MIGQPLKCWDCTCDYHENCYNDGVCECNCISNKKHPIKLINEGVNA